jgi:hypothetical protein
MNLVVNNLSTVTGSFIAACCSSDMSKIAILSASTAIKGIYISTNKGANWTQTTSATIPNNTPTNYWRAITCSNDFSKLIAGISGDPGGGIYYSSDSGSTWTKSSVADRNCYGFAGNSDLSISYAVINNTTSGGIYKSTNFGATWTQVNVNNRTYSFVCCSSDATKVAVTILDGTNNASNWGILISTDSGATWTGKTLTSGVTPQFFRSICCTPDFTKLAAVTHAGNSGTKLWISTDSGANWTNKETSIYTSNNMDNIAISASNDLSHIVICNYSVPSGSAQISGVYYSVDSGTTFRMAQMPGTFWSATCFSKTTDEFVAVSGADGIYRGTFVNGTTSIKNTRIDINMITSNFSTNALEPRMQIGLSNSIHMPVLCGTFADNASISLIMNEYASANYTGVSFWPTVETFNNTDLLFFYWNYNLENVTTKYYKYFGITLTLFTGQHKTLPDDPTIKQNLLQNVGLIMSSNDTGYTSCDSENNVYSGKRAIYINEALPNCSLSVIDEDPCVFGIITNNTNGNSGKYDDTTTEFCTSLNDSVRVNSLGEGAIWVSNINGLIQNGDWITTSRIPGVGKKQNEIRRCNYTVAKATMSCDFDLGSDKYKSKTVEFEGQTYVMAFISVTYHCG